MDCNQVFMILTRGPFPTGEPWDEEVEAHLETCADCWRLAEALRPALEVFQEAVPPAESRELPGYWGDARPTTGSTSSGAYKSMARVAMASGTRRVTRAYESYQHYPLASGLPTRTWRAAALVMGSALAAAATGMVVARWFW